jgi:hypothetical protein
MNARRFFSIACLFALLFCSNTVAGDVNPQAVQRALERGAEATLRNLRSYERTNNSGYSIIAVMALLNAGVPADRPEIVAAIKTIERLSDVQMGQYEGTYHAGLINTLLAMLKNPQQRRLAERMTQNLMRFQNADGGWGDYSRTQFGLLGLKAATDMGIKVPIDVFKRARRFLELGQAQDGSWGYVPSSGAGYGSMTAAGISSLFIINEQIYKASNVCGGMPNDERMQRAMAWLGANFAVDQNPRSQGYHFYYLYALERIGVLMGQRYIGGHDWYRKGVEFLLPRQTVDGQWQGDILATEFAMLFIGKGREPVVMQKLAYAGEWNTDPYDAKDLVEQASLDLELPMTTQVVNVKDGASAFAEAPVLYLQGHSSFEFTPEQRIHLRVFLESGGFIFASACCGSRDFDASFRAEMGQIFPDARFERLPASHDIYRLRHLILHPNAFMIEGLNTGCRTSVFYAPHDICCAWGECGGCRDALSLGGDEGKKLGVNMLAYVLNFKKLKDKLAAEDPVAESKDVAVAHGALPIGQLYHDGEWNPDPGSLANLGETLKEQTGGAMSGVQKRKVVPGTDELGDYPVLYITGHKSFLYNPSQVEALRTYLERGGFLLADPCCGKVEFDAAFRRLCEQMFPNAPLTAVQPGHAILTQPYEINGVEYKPAVRRLFPQLGHAPQLEAITNADGRVMVLYSRFNLGCELQGHGCAACLGVAGVDAYKIAVNALLYALSH